MKTSRLFSFLFLAIAILVIPSHSLHGQGKLEDYHRADSLARTRDLVYYSGVRPSWIKETQSFWYSCNTPQGNAYFLVDASKARKVPAFNTEKMVTAINLVTGKKLTAAKLILEDLSFDKDLKNIEFVIDSFRWKCNLVKYKLTRGEKIKPTPKEEYWGNTRDELGHPPMTSPDSTQVAFIRNFNVFVRDKSTGKEMQLSFDGASGEPYSSYVVWSPDSKKLVTCRVRLNTPHLIYFVESSPRDQLQPKLHTREYLKPGDALPIYQPSLFNVADKKQIPVDTRAFENQFSIDNITWYKDSHAFTFEFNQRGHQVYQVVQVDAATGNIKVLIDERSTTFIDYSSKKYRYDVEDGKEILWASERDGWNHLYLYDGTTGTVKNQVTHGEWVVRGVEYVDEKNQQVWFRASGFVPGKDPYLIHFCRINFDGTGFIDLTPEDANHFVTFSDDKKYFTDVYSRVDQPPVAVLRQASDGKVLMTVEKADISALLATGWKMPEVFMAPGRDGKTDIWGIIIRPSNFDPARTYPVIENIYAGPHSSFVPKSFSPYFGAMSGLAELGFIVVQIDGMGTSNRSKAFHDVCWKNLRDAGFPDRIAWMKAAATKYPYMDLSRVGIFGTSAGGQNALAGMLFHPEFYTVCVSSCGCHDNRMDKIWWNEQWMGYPVGPEYDSCSNVTHASRLQGKLLLMVGEVDDNVDPSSTLQVVDALVRAKKDFDLLVLPGFNHTSGGPFGDRKRMDFFVKNLLQVTPPDWNIIHEKK